MTGSTPAPTVTGYTLTRVNISGTTTATQVATLLAASIQAYSPTLMIATSLNDIVTVSNAGNAFSVGSNFVITAENSDFSVDNTQIGTNTLPRNMNVSDVFAISEQTIIPQFPVELHSMLAQRIAMRCLESLGDQAGLQAAAVKLLEMEQKTGQIIDNRVEGSPQKIAPKHTFLRSNRNFLRR